MRSAVATGRGLTDSAVGCCIIGRTQDASQEVLIKLLRKRDTLRQGGISALLYKMARNHCIDVLRRLRARVPQLTESELEAIWNSEADDTNPLQAAPDREPLQDDKVLAQEFRRSLLACLDRFGVREVALFLAECDGNMSEAHRRFGGDSIYWTFKRNCERRLRDAIECMRSKGML